MDDSNRETKWPPATPTTPAARHSSRGAATRPTAQLSTASGDGVPPPRHAASCVRRVTAARRPAAKGQPPDRTRGPAQRAGRLGSNATSCVDRASGDRQLRGSHQTGHAARHDDRKDGGTGPTTERSRPPRPSRQRRHSSAATGSRRVVSRPDTRSSTTTGETGPRHRGRPLLASVAPATTGSRREDSRPATRPSTMSVETGRCGPITERSRLLRQPRQRRPAAEWQPPDRTRVPAR